MRMTHHSVQVPTWTETDYGERKATYGASAMVPMFVAWTTETDVNEEGEKYASYEFVALTKRTVPIGALIDGKMVVERVEPGRINRLFMNLAKGMTR